MGDVVLKRLTKKFNEVQAVDDVSLRVPDGEFLVLLGPSGCGKSTLLRMIAGLEPISAGEITIGGRVVNDLHPKDRDIAMVFQNYALYAHMSVFDNMAFSMQLKKMPQAEIKKRVDWAASILDLTSYLGRFPRQLSGGQRQRVALARAIVREPTVFLMDEPLSNLDAKLRVSTRAQIKNLQHTLKTTTIYVTHDQIEAMTLADRVVVMNKGLIQQVGTPTEIYDAPANTFVAGFIGSPAMNLIDGNLSGGVFEAPNVRIDGLPRTHSGPVTLGFRAEDAAIVPGNGQLAAPVYSLELLGEASMISYRIGESLVSVKAPKEYRAEIDDIVHAAIPASICHLFEKGTGQRIWAGNVRHGGAERARR